MNPIEQFEISPWASLGSLGNLHFAFTNSAFYMVLILAIIAVVTLMATSSRALVPGRLQSAVEMIYEFMADTVRQSAGEEGMRFFPLVFSLFAFILVSAGVIVLRRLEPDRARPFRTPLVPWVPLFAIASCLVLMFFLPTITWYRFFGWLVLGFVIYFLYGRKHSRLTGTAAGAAAIKPSP